MGKKEFKNFFIFWISQFASSLGSSMTGFAIAIWAYAETGSVLTLSISGIAVMLPKLVGGIFAGPIVDRVNKKTILLCADIGAGLCSCTLFLLLRGDVLTIGHVYCLNVLSSLFSCFQIPASDVIISQIVPQEQYTRASAMQSFARGTVEILSSAFAAVLLAAVGMTGVVLFDLGTLVFACVTVFLFLRLPAMERAPASEKRRKGYFSDLGQGFRMLLQKKFLVTIAVFFIFINFVAGVTYYNLITPMILARTGQNPMILAWVKGALGVGSVVGGILTAALPASRKKARTIFLCTGLSFFLGDILLAVGRVPVLWVVAAFSATVFIPAISANRDYLWRTSIPVAFHGRVFAIKYAFESGAVPVGIFVGGVLADFVFEPYMMGAGNIFSVLVGNSAGSGMALMFLLTGIIGALISVVGIMASASIKE